MRGFSLVELSIVLVILGLLTGGILAGQSLIRAAELRAVTTEFQRYATAAYSFRDKYFAIPGDWSNAQAVWGAQGTNCSGTVTTLTTTGTCNGNGDGMLGAAGAASQNGENMQFWRQLALAGLIEGNYTGIAGAGAANEQIPGTTVPRSKMNNAGWGVNYIAPSFAGSATAYKVDYSNYFAFGAPIAGDMPAGAALKPEEAWNIDTKMDDGKSGTGKVIARDAVGFAVTGSCTNSTSATDYTDSYNLSNSAIACAFLFPHSFN